MSYRRYSMSDFSLESVTKEQNDKINTLIYVKDFMSVSYDKGSRTFSTTGFEEYETLIRFLKKLVNIVPNFKEKITVEDTEEDTYWMIFVDGKKMTECHGVVVWGLPEEKAKVKAVLDAHIETSPERMKEMLDQIFLALKGQYDELEDITDEDVESLDALVEDESDPYDDYEEEVDILPDEEKKE